MNDNKIRTIERLWADHNLMFDKSSADLEFRMLHSIIMPNYNEPTRFYHTIDHILYCLAAFDEARDYVRPVCDEEIVMALWFHDLIYKQRYGENNELLSASMAEYYILSRGGSMNSAERVRAMILNTTHFVLRFDELTIDEKFMLDLDLKILGETEEKYNEYAHNVRSEYRHVEDNAYASGRTIIMRQILERKSIFLTDYFRDTYEHIARENIKKEIAQLSS